MSEISRTALFGKLNRPAYKAIEGATVYCKMRGNPYVELVHWLHQILQLPDSDLHRIIRQFDVNPATLARDFTDALDVFVFDEKDKKKPTYHGQPMKAVDMIAEFPEAYVFVEMKIWFFPMKKF